MINKFEDINSFNQLKKLLKMKIAQYKKMNEK